MTLYFKDEEKREFLKKRGYAVLEKTIQMAYPAYHNDMEYEDVVVWAVLKGGKDYMKPLGYNFGKNDWIDAVFNAELPKRLLEVLS